MQVYKNVPVWRKVTCVFYVVLLIVSFAYLTWGCVSEHNLRRRMETECAPHVAHVMFIESPPGAYITFVCSEHGDVKNDPRFTTIK